jgi:hypothetical protein
MHGLSEKLTSLAGGEVNKFNKIKKKKPLDNYDEYQGAKFII